MGVRFDKGGWGWGGMQVYNKRLKRGGRIAAAVRSVNIRVIVK